MFNVRIILRNAAFEKVLQASDLLHNVLVEKYKHYIYVYYYIYVHVIIDY